MRRAAAYTGLPVLVTENGLATEDDPERIEFITTALQGLHRCISDGIDVRGYFVWSLLDNFEWHLGIRPQARHLCGRPRHLRTAPQAQRPLVRRRGQGERPAAARRADRRPGHGRGGRAGEACVEWAASRGRAGAGAPSQRIAIVKGDRVEVVVDVGDGVQRFDIRATQAGRRVEIANVTRLGGGHRGDPLGSGRAHGPLHGGPGRGRRRTSRRGLRALSGQLARSRSYDPTEAPPLPPPPPPPPPSRHRTPPRPWGSPGSPSPGSGFGLAALGRPAYITLGRDADLGSDRARYTMEQRCHDMLDAAYAAGIRYVDTARSYGRAEEFLASWLAARGLAPASLTVGSKWGYRYVGGWDMAAACTRPRTTAWHVP